MQDRTGTYRAIAALVAALVLAGASAARAQETAPPPSVSDFRLPPQPSPGAAPAQGPVDREVPAVITAAPRGEAEPSAPPEPHGAQTATAAPQPAPAGMARDSAARRQPSAPAPDPAAEPAPIPQAPAIAPPPQSAPSGAAAAGAQVAAPPARRAGGPLSWWWLAFGAFVVLTLAGWLAVRRRTGEEADGAAPPSSAPSPAPPAALPEPAFAEGSLAVRFEPQSLQLSVVFATLTYRIHLTNRAGSHSPPLWVSGDMIAAHASLDAAAQLDPGAADLARLHHVPALAPGEVAVLSGQLRLPLRDITAMKKGRSAYFVPLIRFGFTSAETGREDEDVGQTPPARVFALGQQRGEADGTLAPFRIEDGLLLYRALDHREIDTRRWLSLDAAPLAG